MNNTEKKETYIIARANSLKHALRGMFLFARITPNFWVHFFTFIVLIVLGFVFSISRNEWLAVVIANGVVIGIEAVNSAIEIDMNVTHPDYNPMVRDTKDIAAGAVLIVGIISYFVDAVIFLPKIAGLFS